jgi:Bacterial protein of unknown function (DUF922)
VARQRIASQEGSASAAADRDLLDPAADALVRASGPGPGHLAVGLQHADPWTRTRAVQRLQAGLGNAAVGALLGRRHVRTTHLQLERRADEAEARTTIQREDGDVPDDGAQALDTTTAGGGGATETIGPPTSSSYAVTGSSLADVLAAISGRDEAGHVGWEAIPKYAANTGTKVDTASVNVTITIDMPSWTPPATMLPRAKAEWTRWYAALLAHEQGHIALIHTVYDGLAKQMIGKTLSAAGTVFSTADATMQPKSDAYDKKTDHGLKTGTILDVGIETLELDEEKKKKEAAAKANERVSAVPDVPEDE